MAKIKSIYSKKELKAVQAGSFLILRDDGERDIVMALTPLHLDGSLSPAMNKEFELISITVDDVFCILGTKFEFPVGPEGLDAEYDFTEEEARWSALAQRLPKSKAPKVWPYVSVKKAEKAAKKAAKKSK